VHCYPRRTKDSDSKNGLNQFLLESQKAAERYSVFKLIGFFFKDYIQTTKEFGNE